MISFHSINLIKFNCVNDPNELKTEVKERRGEKKRREERRGEEKRANKNRILIFSSNEFGY